MTVSFDSLTQGVSKRVAAASFMEVLNLKTWGRVEAQQLEPFSDILLTRSAHCATATATAVRV